MTSSASDALLIRRLLPPLQVLSVVCLLFAAVAVFAAPGSGSGAETTVAVLYGGAVPTVAVLWVLRDRARSSRGRAVLTVVVGLVLIPVALLGQVGFSIPVLITAVALMVVDVGTIGGIVAVLVIGATGALLHVTGGNGVLVALSNALPVAVLLCFGIALGSALRAYERALARDRRTIAERDEALVRLEEAIDRLRRTAEIEKELLLADERARSARDLHDGLGHRLTLISMSLEFARRARETDPGAAWDEVATAETTAREALTEMRTWVRALSPVRDRDATGAAAFEAIAESFRGTGLEVVVDAGDPDLELTSEAPLLLYRTVQEGLTNALRHGSAEHVRITLGIEDAAVVLRVLSDLDEAARERIAEGETRRGFGLRGLAERAATLDGHVSAGRSGDRFELLLRLPAARSLGAEDDGGRSAAAAPEEPTGPDRHRPAGGSAPLGEVTR